MFARITPIPMLAVKDVARARRFYADTMGLDEDKEGMEGILQFRAGDTVFVVYPSEYAGTNKATALTWVRPDRRFKASAWSRGLELARQTQPCAGAGSAPSSCRRVMRSRWWWISRTRSRSTMNHIVAGTGARLPVGGSVPPGPTSGPV